MRPLFLLAAAFCLAEAQDAPKLTIERPFVSPSEDGTPVNSAFEFAPGDNVYFSCHLTGYQKMENDNKETVSLAWKIEAKDAQGTLLVEPEEAKLATEVSPEDKHWMPKVRFSFVVPPFAGTGEYKISFTASDLNSKSQTQGELTFHVRGREVAPSETLIVRNFRFLRAEEDRNPLQVAAYAPGDTIWARFEMTGYRLATGNALDIDYGLNVLGPGGVQSYALPKAAAEKSQSFYPQRYSPGVLSLVTPKDIKTGEYVLVLTVHDNIGQQMYEMRQRFSIE